MTRRIFQRWTMTTDGRKTADGSTRRRTPDEMWRDRTDEASMTIIAGTGNGPHNIAVVEDDVARIHVPNVTGTPSRYGTWRDKTDDPAYCVTSSDPKRGGHQARGGMHAVATTPGEREPNRRPAPPYVPLTMADVDAAEPNGLTIASTFAGTGGSSIGYRLAGYRIAWANEFVEHAAHCYELNATEDFTVDRRDVREVSASEILEACGGEVDLLDGSPPCQPFSTAGRNSRTWGTERDYGDHRQRADDLFDEFTRLVGEVRPRAFVAENVAGLAIGVSKGYLAWTLRDLRAHGYRVAARILDAQWLGVPQHRERLYIIGIREDLERDPVFPKPLPWRWAMADALPWLVGHELDRPGHGYFPGDRRDLEDREAPTVPATSELGMGDAKYAVRPKATGWDRVAHGFTGPMDAIEFNEPVSTVTAEQVAHGALEPKPTGWNRDANDYTGGEVDPASEPSKAVIASNNHLAITANHPPVDDPEEGPRPCSPSLIAQWRASSAGKLPGAGDPRKFSIVECRRLCGFPDDFRLSGSYSERWARLGNSVPPPVARAVGEALRPVLEH